MVKHASDYATLIGSTVLKIPLLLVWVRVNGFFIGNPSLLSVKAHFCVV